jgi:hypothetical protein
MAESSTAGTLWPARVTLELALATDEAGSEPLLVAVCRWGSGRVGHAAVGGRGRQSGRHVTAVACGRGVVLQQGWGNVDDLEFGGVEMVHSLGRGISAEDSGADGKTAARQTTFERHRQLRRSRMSDEEEESFSLFLSSAEE